MALPQDPPPDAAGREPGRAYSVIIPAYNAAPTLPEAVASLVGQTCPPARIIVVDDGSTDGTGALSGRLGAEVIRQENRGPGAAFALRLPVAEDGAA